MSLTSALYSSVSGMRAQSAALAVVSENISNSSTTAYKTRGIDFTAMVNGSVRNATGGVNYATHQNVSAKGSIQNTGISSNIAIDGQGFFVVSSDVNDPTSAYKYSRNGKFGTDNNGYLVNNEGYYLYGQRTDAKGNVIATNSNDLNSLEPINVKAITGTAKATSKMTMDINLPADLDLANPPANYPFTTTMEIFDSLGISHSVDVSWTKTGVNTWEASYSNTYRTGDPLKTSTGTIDTGDGNSVIEYRFDSNGALLYADGDGDGAHDAPLQLSITGLNASTGASDMVGANALTLDVGTVGRTDGLTQFSSDSDIPDIDIKTIEQDGVRYGLLSGYEISKEGIVTALFDNGVRQPIYQIPIATFPNPNGLTHLGGSVYDENNLAGNYNLRKPGEGNAGMITPESLEMSNTDTSQEFNNLIIAQQAYSAGAQVMSTADDMFDVLMQAVR